MGRPTKIQRRDPHPKRGPDGRWGDGQHLWCRHRTEGWREAEILGAKQQGSDADNKVWMYYVHWIDFNRRMDDWVAEKDLAEKHPLDPSKELEFRESTAIAVEKERKRQGETQVVEFVEEEYGEEAGMDAAAIREHEEVTKFKNIARIQMGRHVAEAWYFTPIPGLTDTIVDVLHICEFCLEWFLHESEMVRHYSKCTMRHPPGDEIYRDPESGLAMFEVDGSKSVVYSQNLCYLAKLFLDHKTLHFDTEPFLFYVLCELDSLGYHIVGYFSKEKYSEAGFNLACILALPQYQQRGFGTFLISFSYEISKKEEKVGSPEKPLSDLGQISYRKYWSNVILELLKEEALKALSNTDVNASQAPQLSIMDLSLRTAIKSDDIIYTLAYWNILKEDPSTGGTFIDASIELLDACLAQVGGKRAVAKVKPELLLWAPLKVEVKRDKWSMRSKVRRVTTGRGAGSTAGGFFLDA